jgi:hypothetical protein
MTSRVDQPIVHRLSLPVDKNGTVRDTPDIFSPADERLLAISDGSNILYLFRAARCQVPRIQIPDDV